MRQRPDGFHSEKSVLRNCIGEGAGSGRTGIWRDSTQTRITPHESRAQIVRLLHVILARGAAGPCNRASGGLRTGRKGGDAQEAVGIGGIGVRQVFLRFREAVAVVVAAAVQRAEVIRIGQFPSVRQAVAVGIVAPEWNRSFSGKLKKHAHNRLQG